MNAVLEVAVRFADQEFDENQVTPGVWGFIATFAIMAIVVLLVLDMVRRIRRVNYRAEAQARLDAEEAERQAADLGGDDVEPPAADDGR
ncbi:hypothetical protein ACDF64_17610 [Agromyces sp. MMS24-JH15]|uniref:hypothetical protein n=1 Tax=Agromyces sp. MMS24-JH15 TaxID=3243765 RepID=UPI0037479BA6